MNSATNPALHFARTAHQLALAARAAGLVAPAFRSPPRGSAPRTIRRLPGGPIVAVRVSGRGFGEIDADMVDGVIAANGLVGEAAMRLRRTLLDALDASRDTAAA